MVFYWTAIVAGFVGSFHCIGMCGPIAMSLPLPGKAPSRRVVASGLYNLGRLTSYSLLGAVAGLVGQAFFLAGSQRLVSVLLGTLLILAIALPAFIIKKASPSGMIFRTTNRLKYQLRKQLGHRSLQASYLIGLLNGLLPCGLVYLGIAAAMSSGDLIHGSLYMLLMGLGTFPAMLVASFLGNWISVEIRHKMTASAPIFVCFMGLLLILRGMALDIPYLSPLISDYTTNNIIICH